MNIEGEHSSIPANPQNENGVETLHSPPNFKRLFEMLQYFGLDVLDAMREITDGALQAGASLLRVSIEDKSIIVADDGAGFAPSRYACTAILCSEPEAIDAFKRRIGQFGMGLKIGLSVLCREVRVITKQTSDPFPVVLIPMKDEVKKRFATPDEKEQFEKWTGGHHGTVFFLTDLKLTESQIIDLRKGIAFDLSLHYHRFIEHPDTMVKRLHVFVGKDELDALDPLCRRYLKDRIVCGHPAVQSLVSNRVIELPVSREESAARPVSNVTHVAYRKLLTKSEEAKLYRYKSGDYGLYVFVYREERLVRVLPLATLDTAGGHLYSARVELLFTAEDAMKFHMDIKKTLMFSGQALEELQRELYPYIETSKKIRNEELLLAERNKRNGVVKKAFAKRKQGGRRIAVEQMDGQSVGRRQKNGWILDSESPVFKQIVKFKDAKGRKFIDSSANIIKNLLMACDETIKRHPKTAPSVIRTMLRSFSEIAQRELEAEERKPAKMNGRKESKAS